MNTVRKSLAGLGLSVASLGLLAGAAGAVTPATGGTSCTVSKVAVTKVEHVKVHGKTVTKRVVVHVKKREKIHGKWVVREVVKYRTVETCTIPSPVVQTPVGVVQTPVGVATTAAAPVVSYSAYVDPTFTQNPANPLDVTYTYDAGAISTLNSVTTDLGATGQLPNGILNLYSNGVLECSTNVGGSVTGGTCEVIYGGYGAQQVITTYESGSSSATETDTENIANPNPPPPVLSTTTVVNVGAEGSNYTPVSATVVDANGGAVSSGSVSYQLRLYWGGRMGSPSVPPIVGPVGTTCQIEIQQVTEPGYYDWNVSSSNCSGGGTLDDEGVTGSLPPDSITVTGTYSGATYDLGSTSPTVAYP